jgi:chorismate dehydratase
MLHGAQRDLFNLSFCLPSECARRLAEGEAALGIVPVIEKARQGLVMVPGTGIACRGAVRSILLVSRVQFGKIRTLATDSGSRTSVELARIILAHRYGVLPEIVSMAPELAPMLEEADAALIIGDPALRLDPSKLPYHVIDLGE